MNPLTFVPFTTFVDPQFWNEVNRRKVDEWHLDNSTIAVKATYETCKIILLAYIFNSRRLNVRRFSYKYIISTRFKFFWA